MKQRKYFLYRILGVTKKTTKKERKERLPPFSNVRGILAFWREYFPALALVRFLRFARWHFFLFLDEFIMLFIENFLNEKKKKPREADAGCGGAVWVQGESARAAIV